MTGEADFRTKVVNGEVRRWSIMHALGERESIGTTAAGEDLWRGNELTPAPTSHTTIPRPADVGEQMTVIGESVNDTAAGTGIQQVRIDYLDAAGDMQQEVVIMNGTTGVNTVATDMRFINNFEAEAVGSGGVAAGHIKIYKTGSAGLVYDMIALGGNKSLVSHRMVPRGHELILQMWHATEGQRKRAVFRIRSTDNNGVLLPGVFIFKDTTYINGAPSPEMVLTDRVPAFSVVKVSCWAAVTGAEGSCHWWGYLVDKT